MSKWLVGWQESWPAGFLQATYSVVSVSESNSLVSACMQQNGCFHVTYHTRIMATSMQLTSASESDLAELMLWLFPCLKWQWKLVTRLSTKVSACSYFYAIVCEITYSATSGSESKSSGGFRGVSGVSIETPFARQLTVLRLFIIQQ